MLYDSIMFYVIQYIILLISLFVFVIALLASLQDIVLH
jgi:hypothetical protein